MSEDREQREAARERAARRARLDAVFGDVLPESTTDDRDADPPRGGRADERGDAWLREQVPPHHGGS